MGSGVSKIIQEVSANGDMSVIVFSSFGAVMDGVE